MRMLVAWSAASRSLGTATLCTERSEVVVGVRVVRVVVVPLLLILLVLEAVDSFWSFHGFEFLFWLFFENFKAPPKNF